MRSTWIEALAMVDMVTGKFGVASTRLPPMSRPSDRTAISEPDQQTLEGATKAAEEYLAQIVGRFSPGQAKPKEINGEDPVTNRLTSQPCPPAEATAWDGRSWEASPTVFSEHPIGSSCSFDPRRNEPGAMRGVGFSMGAVMLLE
jgi:hypothetical protein